MGNLLPIRATTGLPAPPATPATDPLLVDSAEAARLLTISTCTLWSITAPRGTLAVVKIGRTVRYSRAALLAWIGQQASSSTPPGSGPA